MTVTKLAAVERAKDMFGRLYASASGWILLSTPNAIGRGVFDTLQEPGLELPPGPSGGPYSAHVSVIRDSELEALGGVDAISERGHSFPFSVGHLMKITNPDWKEMSVVYALEVHSPALEQLRRSYGLPSLPHKGGKEFPFHLTVAVRRKNVLYDNGIAKQSSLVSHLLAKLTAAA
jgi:hypothetical protein